MAETNLIQTQFPFLNGDDGDNENSPVVFWILIIGAGILTVIIAITLYHNFQ